MKKIIVTVILILMVVVSACSGTEGTADIQENDNLSEESSTVVTDSADTAVDTADDPAQENSETTDTTVEIISEDTDTSATEDGETSYSTVNMVSDEEKAMYLAGIMPVVERHNISRNTLTEAETTFTLAMPPTMDHIEDYCLALSTEKPLVNAQYEDAYAVTPPGGLSRFHYDFYTAIYKYNEYIINFLNYYEEVLETGTGDLACYEKGNSALMEANQLWWNYIMPEIQKMLN